LVFGFHAFVIELGTLCEQTADGRTDVYVTHNGA